jgi:hypothetical protein
VRCPPFFTWFHFPGVDIWRRLVQHVAGPGRLDVHRVHPQPVRHLAGPLRGRDEAHNVPQHHVPLEGQNADRRSVGPQFRDLLPAPCGVEGQPGKWCLDRKRVFRSALALLLFYNLLSRRS